MEWNQNQLELAAKTLADLAKIVFASTVIGFFAPGFSGNLNISSLIMGAVSAAGLFFSGALLLKSDKKIHEYNHQ